MARRTYYCGELQYPSSEPTCRTCSTSLAGVEEIAPGSGVYDRMCPKLGGEQCVAKEVGRG